MTRGPGRTMGGPAGPQRPRPALFGAGGTAGPGSHDRATAPAGAPDHPGEGRALQQANGQRQDLNWLVTDFTERVPAVVHAAVVSADGVPLAVSDGISPDRQQQLSAITSGLVSLAKGSALMLDGGAVTQTLVTMEQGVMVTAAISDGASLAVLAVIDADLDQVTYEMTVLAEQAGSVITPDVRTPPEAAGEPA